MKIRVLGGGWYGSHIALALQAAGHDVHLHEIARHLFAGASGANPARCHMGQHYPRSRLTRAACQDHHAEFMAVYGHLTRGVPVNLYCIAENDSLMDFGTYCQVLHGEIEFIRVDPQEFGLAHVEGAILTGERHIVIDEARAYFESALREVALFNAPPGVVDSPEYDLTIDCTFCANDAESIDRYEPCITVLLEGPVDRCVTIMDGPFPSLYVWNEERELSSLTSAKLTPLSKTCRTWAEARRVLEECDGAHAEMRMREMFDQMAFYWPDVKKRYRLHDYRLAIRAMPRSGADARLVDVVRVGERALRVRAGKIDAIFAAERMIKEAIAAG